MRRTDICYTCRHWLGAGVRQRGPKGQCRRYPPLITDRAPNGAFPTTDSSDWCGEWSALPGTGRGEPPVQERDEVSAAGSRTLYDDL